MIRLVKSVISLSALLVTMTGFATTPGHAAVITFTGQFTGNETLQADNRLFRNATPSVAGTQKPFPGTTSNTGTVFDIDQIMVMPGSIVTITENNNNSTSAFFSVYDSLFNPSNLSLNYLGDAGLSGPGVAFSINAPLSGDIFLVANSVNGSSIGETYSATVAYTAVSSVPLPASAPLFGAGLLALGAAGYAAKRKKAANAT